MVPCGFSLELDPRSLNLVGKFAKVSLLLLSATFIGCASSSKAPQTSVPATISPNRPAIANRGVTNVTHEYEKSISCILMEEDSEVPVKEHLSALTGFAVGPRAAEVADDLSKPVLRPFSSDGCSSSLDGIPFTKNSEAWVDCCIQHDVAYWSGGTEQEKQIADDGLKACMGEKGYPEIGKVYETFVNKFGGPKSTQSYRWGYGWNFKRDYGPLSENDERQVRALQGMDRAMFAKSALQQNFSLQKICDSFDPIFWGLRVEEKVAYRFLNSRLKKNNVIEWARWGYFNRDVQELNIKLRSCANPVSVAVSRDPQIAPVLKTDCDL